MEENLNLEKAEGNERNFLDDLKPTFPKQPITSDKKRTKPKKKFFIMGILLIIGIGVIAGFYFWEDLEKLIIPENTSDIEQATSNLNTLSEEGVESEEERDPFRYDIENPRVSIRNGSGDEVIGLGHNGSIAAANIYLDENVNATGNVTGGSGFFKWIGSLANEVTKLWSTDVVTGELNATGNITVEGIKLEANQADHFIYDNASCIIIDSSTSILYIC